MATDTSEPSGLFSWIPSFFDKFTGWLVELLPDWLGSGFAELNDLLGPTVQYLLWVTGMDVVVLVTFGAYVVKFLIRRIPIIG